MVMKFTPSSYWLSKIAPPNLVRFNFPPHKHYTKRAINTKQPCEYAIIVRTYHRVEPKQIGRKS